MPYRDDWFEAERLHRASQEGNIREMDRLIVEGCDINLFDDLGRTALHYAVEEGRYEAAIWLISHGANVNANEDETIGETPLALAVQRDYPEIVELLMQNGADPDISGWMGLTARIRANKRTDDAGTKIRAILKRYER